MQDFYGIEPPPKETPPPRRLHKAVRYIIVDKAGALRNLIANARAPKELAPLLVNKKYYDDIDAKMARTWRPTVADAIKAMCRQGNVAYYDAWPELGEHGRKPRFSKHRAVHEIMHLAGRFAHTMQNELFGSPFELGMNYGVAVRQMDEDEAIQVKETVGWAANKNHEITHLYQSGAVETAAPRDVAIYFAAGMYLREKVDFYRREGLKTARYAQQKEFCASYAKADHVPTQTSRGDVNPLEMEDIRHAPYDLIKFSREEWRAITAVATGLAEPEDTPYPKRLTAIKDALVHAGLFHDMKPVFEKAAENHEPNIRSYNAKVEEKNRTTHAESPQKYAAVRGVDREMHHAARLKRHAPEKFTDRVQTGESVTERF